MIMMLVSETQDKSRDVINLLKEESINMVHYNSPMKALDNLQEIRPDALIIDAVDFPRHWKVLTQYLRYDTSKNDVVIILIVNSHFSHLDVDKALKAGVQGVINVEMPVEATLKAAKDIFTKYKCLAFKSGNKGSNPASANCSFLFVEPSSMSIVTGKVREIRTSSLLFIPDTKIEDLKAGDVLVNCSLKLKDKIITPHCKIIEVKNYLNLEFMELSSEDEKVIEEFLNREREEEKDVV